MSRWAVLSLHPETRREIERVRQEGVAVACGCRSLPDPAHMWVCEYHEGFDAGCEAIERSGVAAAGRVEP